MASEHFDVIIVGAGIAGLSAAQELHGVCKSILILEGRSCAGGRIRSHAFAGMGKFRVNIGANFIHGCDPDGGNVVFNLAEDCGIQLESGGYDHDRWRYTDGSSAHIKDVNKMKDFYEEMDRLLVDLARKRREAQLPDISIKEAIDEIMTSFTLTPQKRQMFDAMMVAQHAYVANASDLSLNDMLYLVEDAPGNLEGEHKVTVTGFYSIIEELLKGLEHCIRYEETVVSITQEQGGCAVMTQCNGGDRNYTASRVLVTASLGVLQSDLIKFSPPLSEEKCKSIRTLRMGLENRVAFHFKQCFWRTQARFIHVMGLPFGLRIFNVHSFCNKNVLLLFIAPPFSWELESMSDDAIIDLFLDHLSKIFKATVTRESLMPNGYVISRWGSDIFARGSYSYVPVGAHITMASSLAKKEGRIYFAGEAASLEDMQLTHGARTSALKAAEEMIVDESIEKGNVPPLLISDTCLPVWVQWRLLRWQQSGDCSMSSKKRIARICGITVADIDAWYEKAPC